jgi:hypothetical protein
MDLDTKYAALFLKEVNGGAIRKSSLWQPLALACLISEYSRLLFPMRSSVSSIVDSAFDESLKYLERGKHKTLKDFVTNSQGILYLKDLSVEESARVLEYAAFTLTTDEKIEETALEEKLPHIFIYRRYGNELNARTRYLEGNYYEQLGRNLPRYIEISSQIGHFSGTNHPSNGRIIHPELIGETPQEVKTHVVCSDLPIIGRFPKIA